MLCLAFPPLAPLPVSAFAVCAWRSKSPMRQPPVCLAWWPVPALAHPAQSPQSCHIIGDSRRAEHSRHVNGAVRCINWLGGNESVVTAAARAEGICIYLAFPSIGDVPESAVRGGALGLRCSPRQPTEMAAHVCQVAGSQARHDLIGRVLTPSSVAPGRLARNEKLSRFLRTALRCHLACKLCPGQWRQPRCRPPRWRSRRQSRPMSPRPQTAESVRPCRDCCP